jgi:DNA-binding transcriptional MerR regulator
MSLRTRAVAKSARTTDVVIPEKLYFRIGEVARLCRLPAYVLRFWETEFPQLKPVKSSTGQRMYRHKDVESVLRIKKLLMKKVLPLPAHASISGRRSRETKNSPRYRSRPAPPQN